MVDLAKLFVVANQKSIIAIVRVTADILDSIQVLFQVKNLCSCSNSASEGYINLILFRADDSAQAINQVLAFIFGKK